jgi:hypothetical protein
MPETGILYTEYSRLTARSPFLTSLWSFESRSGDGNHPRVAVNRHGNYEFWLNRTDPLLNVMLPDTSISVVINLADRGAPGRSLPGGLVQALLTHDVSEWAPVATSVGYYDQAHMINEFRLFTGAPPTAFFQHPAPASVFQEGSFAAVRASGCRFSLAMRLETRTCTRFLTDGIMG